MKVAAFFSGTTHELLEVGEISDKQRGRSGHVRIAEVSIFITNISQLFITSNVN
jgi:hypothetical protein